MPLAASVSGLLTAEWSRFTEGVHNLDPAAQLSARQEAGARARRDGAPSTINIPGWDDVVHLTPKHPISDAERAEGRAARSERRPSRNSPAATAAIARNQAMAERIASSAQPDYMRAWASILTAIDNVQDLASTISTFGRLSLWAAARIPAVAEGVAITAELARIRGLGGLAFLAREAELLARLRGLGLLGRVGARAVPGVGWVLLISDLLNLLGLIGSLASPVYALLCGGPAAAFAAGAPTAVFKGSLKRDVWKKATTNPFGRAARAKRLMKAASGRIGVGALLEVAQTTDALWGVGLSFGGIVGLLVETAASVELVARGHPVQINAPLSYEKSGQALAARIQGQSTSDVLAARQAAAVLATAPAIARKQPEFTDEEHLLTMLILTHAVGVLTAWTRGLDVDAMIAEVMDDPITVPRVLDAGRLAELAAAGVDIAAPGRWWLDGFPTVTTPGALVDDGVRTLAPAARAFIRPRRATAEGDLFATLVSQLAEGTWRLWAGDDDVLAWSLMPDYALLAALCEDGFLVNVQDPEARIWKFWTLARAAYVARGDRPPAAADWPALAAQAGITLIRMLPPTAPWPAAWAAQPPPA